MSDYLRLEIDGAIATLHIDRPAKLNALNLEMWQAIPSLVTRVATNPNVAVLIVRGGEHFSAGADITDFVGANTHERGLEFNSVIADADSALSKLGKPTIAAIQGYCVGGGSELAIACDMRIAAPNSRFAITPSKLGLVYPYEGVKALTQLVGPAWAKQILFTGEILDAETALQIGLVNEVTDAWETRVADLANLMATRAPISVQASKTMIRAILDGNNEASPEITKLYGDGFASADFAEGVDAFINKRTPRFGMPGATR